MRATDGESESVREQERRERERGCEDVPKVVRESSWIFLSHSEMILIHCPGF